MDSIRQNKVSRLIQKELSEIFQKECKEYTAGAILSVTTVRVSPDLSYAKVYLSIFPADRLKVVMDTLNDANKNIRFVLGKKVGKQMRVVPELRFFIDDSLDYVEKIDELLNL
ncbi:30S ribosome-binding factor RbfA [Porphyromonadaceae bacterium OttesenSCG-928-L07]|nr:30S ribosome-binding factor RbfA [Porphyromonadaceae bacterium OttesenSCG-928-L07]MDL2330749.1 30S ribosome-binding factor RbfA [Odoribacter sp. OttesenSCG-928-A06]